MEPITRNRNLDRLAMKYRTASRMWPLTQKKVEMHLLHALTLTFDEVRQTRS